MFLISYGFVCVLLNNTPFEFYFVTVGKLYMNFTEASIRIKIDILNIENMLFEVYK